MEYVLGLIALLIAAVGWERHRRKKAEARGRVDEIRADNAEENTRLETELQDIDDETNNDVEAIEPEHKDNPTTADADELLEWLNDL